MTTYSSEHAKRFFTWLDNISAKGKASKAGAILTVQGWDVAHTGGGCLAWEKVRDDQRWYVWITNDEQDLGEDCVDLEAKRWTCGLYGAQEDNDSWLNPNPAMSLADAIAWCEAALADPAQAFDQCDVIKEEPERKEALR